VRKSYTLLPEQLGLPREMADGKYTKGLRRILRAAIGGAAKRLPIAGNYELVQIFRTPAPMVGRSGEGNQHGHQDPTDKAAGDTSQ